MKSTRKAVLEVPLAPNVERFGPAQGAQGIAAEAFDLAEDIERRLALYRRGQAYREPS